MDFVSPIITPIVESVMGRIKRHMGFLVSYTKNVKEMKTNMDKLNLTRDDIQEKKNTADVKNHEVSHHVSQWLKEVKDMNDKVESISSEIGCFSMAKRYKAGKQSSLILTKIEDLKKQGTDIPWTNEQKCLARISSMTSPVPSGTQDNPAANGSQNNFGSRDLIFKSAFKALQPNNDQNMIALCGMGGVGKTTMMEQLKKVAEDSRVFKWIVNVALGENIDLNSLQQAIAQYIKVDLSETTKDARAARLFKSFEEMSKQANGNILVIMDDVWKTFELKDVGLFPLPKGAKLLLTSRFEYVCTQMGVTMDSVFHVRVLDEEEAKTLFFGTVGLSDGDDPDLQNIGEDIVKICGGLPIAIVTIAKVLRGNIKQAWEETLSNLNNHDLQDLGEITYRIFELSYNNLKADDRALFLLSGLFPEDFNISIEDLMIYGWGLKLFTKVSTLAEARRRANVCVNNLIRANLLTESQSIGCVKIHDLVRSFILSNFSKVKQVSVVMGDSKSGMRHIQDDHRSYERILLKCTRMSELPAYLENYDNLSLFILMDGNYSIDFPKDLHKRMGNLEVVSYDGMCIPLQPTPFVHPSKLRTMCLHSCDLVQDHIYIIGSFSNLETLSFAYCRLSMLPSTIGKLKKLKLLDLTECVNLCIEDGIFQNLGSLEELYMRASPGKPIRFTDANYEELKIISQRLFALELEFFENNSRSRYVSFENLKRFRISIGCELKKTEKTSFRNTLVLVTDNNELQESNISGLFEETEELNLQVNDIYNLQDVSMDHTFSQLKVLHVFKCAKLTHLFTFEVASGLKKLEQLTVLECPVLITLVSEKRGVIRFPKLKVMVLEDVPNMVRLCDDKIELPEMVELTLDGLSDITSIYPDNNHNKNYNVCVTQSLLNNEVVIPKLEKLVIREMEKLEQIWPCEIISTLEKSNVSKLKEINLWRCDSLMNLFPSNPLPLLNHLEEIEVQECGSVEVLFNIDLERVHEMEGYTSRLRRIKVWDLRNLKELWRMRSVNNNNSDIVINGFKSVESIVIMFCEGFTKLFTPITTNFDLGALKYYSTYKVGEEIDDDDGNMEIKEVDDCNIPDDQQLTYPSYLLRTSHHLQSLRMEKDRRVGEVVFDEMDTPCTYLEDLWLSNLEEMSHVWKCSNWNAILINPLQHHHQPQLQQLSPFQNLRDIHISDCHKIKYLFSPLTAKYLSNLKSVDVWRCNGIEEVISSRDDENENEENTTSSHQNILTTIFFPRLENLNLSSLPGLKSVDDASHVTIHDQFQSGHVIGACRSFCQYPKEKFKRLQGLVIWDCKTMTEIFKSDQSITNGISSVLVPHLSNLQIVFIGGCHLLPHVFTFSTLESLKQLKKLQVKDCKAMQVIVKEENETISSKSMQVVFPRLQTLVLDDLPNLKGFFLGVNEFKWPSLDDVTIKDCPQLTVFTSSESETQKLKYIRSSRGKHTLESCGLNFQTSSPTSSDAAISKEMSWSFHNLIEINIDCTSVSTIIPSYALLQLQNLVKIHLKWCYMVEEVFEVVALEGRYNNKSGFSESHTSAIKIPNLTEVILADMKCLKYLWKSTQWMIIEFPNLTSLSIEKCPELEHVFTCSMVGSLVQLHRLSITDCKNIEVIVKEEEKQECDDHKVNEIMIMLPRLKSLTLIGLSSLKGFYLGKEAFSFSSLDTLQIKECPSITSFIIGSLSTPTLKVIDTSFGKYIVKPDLNSFIKAKQEEGYEF